MHQTAPAELVQGQERGRWGWSGRAAQGWGLRWAWTRAQLADKETGASEVREAVGATGSRGNLRGTFKVNAGKSRVRVGW